MTTKLRKKLKKNKEPARTGFWPQMLFIGIPLLTIILGGIQIYFTNQTAAQGEEIKNYQQELIKAEQRINQLEKQVQKTSSLSHIEEYARNNLNMIEAQGHILYIQPQHFASAAR